MDALADSETYSSEDMIPCAITASTVRRRRMDMKRFKILASTSIGEPLRKRFKFRSKFREAELRPRQQQRIDIDHHINDEKKCAVNEEEQQQQQQQSDELLSKEDSDGCKNQVEEPSADSNLRSPMDQQCCPQYGTLSVCGRRREMEDAVIAVPSLLSVPCSTLDCTICFQSSATSPSPVHFFGVYDGHGGSQAATFCKQRLHHALVEEMQQQQQVTEWRNALVSCFLKVDAELKYTNCEGEDCQLCGGDGCKSPRVAETVGSTAVVAIVESCQIVIANCGDSRAVLSRGGKAIALSDDHKPNRDDELARVEAAGGSVINWQGYRILGILSMSRAIGDHYMKPFIIANPEVTCTKRSSEDECLILASDGLWGVMSNEEACNYARKCLASRRNNNNINNSDTSSPSSASSSSSSQQLSEETPSSAAASLLIKLALARGSSDNISVIVVDLK